VADSSSLAWAVKGERRRRRERVSTPEMMRAQTNLTRARYISINISIRVDAATATWLNCTEEEMTIIRAERLTTFSVAPDGGSISIGVADEDGRAGSLMLPTACLKELMMTLPEMMRRALRLQHDDPSLRLVYRAAGWEVERSR
jgi:hypothetical protein